MSALRGDNILTPSANTPWYHGPQLMPYLETIEVATDRVAQPMRFPVQWVNRPNLDFRGFSGTVASGVLKVGDDVLVAASRKPAKVTRIVTMDGDQQEAIAGEAVTIVLDREVDISRGDVLTHPGAVDRIFQPVPGAHDLDVGRACAARPLLPAQDRRADWCRPRSPTSSSRPTSTRSSRARPRRLSSTRSARVTIATDKPIAFDPYADNGRTGGFILIDRITNATLGAGMIDFGLRRAQNLSYQSFDVNREVRARLKNQTASIVWFTGLSGSGKSTVANLIEKRLTAEGKHAYILDGDNVRHGLNKDLGFTEEARVENIRRVAEVARLMADAGLIVLVSFISPFRNERRLAREIAGDVGFTEVYVDTPLEVCEARDPKGLYARARRGEIKNFTGIDSPFEPPEHPDVVLHGAEEEPPALADQLYRRLFQ